MDWYRQHADQVRIEPTQTFQDEMRLRENPGHRPTRDLGERAAIEFIRAYALDEDTRVLLLSDDRDVERLVVIDPDRLILLTTWDYLRQLEETQRIQSADAVWEAARKAGRNPPQRDLWSGHDPEIRDAVKQMLAQTRSPDTD